MKIGRVIGSVVCSTKAESLKGIRLMLLQPLDGNMNETGSPIVACDSVQSGHGDIVLFEGGREAALALENWFNPSDAAIIGIVDTAEGE